MYYVPEGKPLFRRQHRRSNPYRVFFLLTLIIGALFVYRGLATGEVVSPFEPTPTPTRVPASFVLQGQTLFEAGDLTGAIAAYQQAIALDPDNASLLAELARLQAYSSTLLTTDGQVLAALRQAKEYADQAIELAPDDSMVLAIKAFVYNWNANGSLVSEEERLALLSEAEQAVTRAIDLDSRNALALAYSAEILVDQQQVLDAEDRIRLALEADDSYMDVHRVNAYVQESLTNYGEAIVEWQKAIELAPNLTFLHLRLGYNYRSLQMYDQALESFARAVEINKQLGIQDPVPYIAIAKTYAQQGEFFAASWNIQTALEYDPANPDLYGVAGDIFYRARNYESAMEAFHCAVRGCDADASCELRQCDQEVDLPVTVEGLPLTEGSKWYYLEYGQVLAALHRNASPTCPEAMDIFREFRRTFPDDELAISIVSAGEAICERFGY